ncbi:hypothetical protein K438DRAFT_1848220 [Mycena galopus ATCC 62051]|nr:hypothetical protein K438DRAFT_1848220 [Mycena galopus ATCC 62051]
MHGWCAAFSHFRSYSQRSPHVSLVLLLFCFPFRFIASFVVSHFELFSSLVPRFHSACISNPNSLGWYYIY